MTTLENNPRLLASAQLVLRLAIGFLFAAHGWQKFSQFTIEGTTASFTQMGVPAASLVAPVVATLELVGGVALILGLATRIVGVLLALDMVGAIAMVHAQSGVFVANGGFELVLALGAGAAALALMGPGGWALDRLFVGRKAARRGLINA
ncbi:DoxX family protein [Glutamicibacter sp. TV12E]|uniref:DoxX family protein n=1 Tax=Glutamicibacter sp. TV12E TaxID=3446362 RepID=UPI004033F470